MDDDIICTEKIIADRKTFFIDLKSNTRGRVVRITEKVSSNRDRIMVPAEILDNGQNSFRGKIPEDNRTPVSGKTTGSSKSG